MKILFILPEYYPHSGGGISTYYINYIKALRPYCQKIKVIVGSGYFYANSSFNIDGVEIESLKPELYQRTLDKFTRFNIDPDLKNNLAAAWAMYQQADEGEGFDIIECTDFALGFIPWVIDHNRPVITRLHGSIGQISLNENTAQNTFSNTFIKQTELLLLPLCDALITHSTANKLFWNGLLDNNKTVKIDPVFFATDQQPLSMSVRENIGLVTSRVQRWKGPVELCEAMTLIGKEQRPLIKWFGRDMPYTKAESTGQYLSKTFPGIWNKAIAPEKQVDNSVIKQLQQKAKFGIIPSTWDMYNFTCLEFLAAGTPVICSDGAGVSEIIAHGKNGLKYQANDINGLAECLKTITNLTEQEYAQMAQSAIETISQLSPQNIVPLNIEQYDLALKNFKKRSANPYLASVYTPEDAEHTIDDVLDKQPLKKISRYFFKRMLTKIAGKK